MRKTFLLQLVTLIILSYGYAQNIPNGITTPNPVSPASINPVPPAFNSGTNFNYIRFWDVKMPSTSARQVVESNQTKERSQITEYTDGFGRVLQNVKKGITPNGKDFVSPRVYDNTGREVFNYLSYPSTTSDGKIKLNAFNEQATYFSTQLQYTGEQVYYSKTNFSNSPLSLMEKSMPVGNSWAGSDKGTEQKYELNGINEVKAWSVNTNINSTPSTSSYYDAAALYRGIIVDASGKRVVSYKDKEGRLVLRKVEIVSTGSALLNSHDGWLCTYYVYDEVSNLRFTITPRAVEWLKLNSWTFSSSFTILEELCFRYEYDNKGRLIISKSPGADEVCTVYDAKDRVVLFRDGNLIGKWKYFLYDNLNRVVETGLWTNSQTRDTHQAQAENTINYPSITSGKEILEQVFYDDYSWLSSCGCGLSATFNASQLNGNWLNTTSSNQFPYPLSLTATQLLLNLKTITKTKILNSNPAKYLYSVSFYDNDGNVIQTASTNITGGVDIVTTQYGFEGKVLASHLQHNYIGTSGQQTQNIYSRFEYDDAGRTLKTFRRINNEAEKIQASNTYNEQNQLIKVKFGYSLATSMPIETQEYTYNLDGTPKAMNKSFAEGSTNDRFFGEILSRDYGFSNVQLTGNIAGVQWRSLGDGERRAFGYAYDPASRVLKSDFTQYNGGWNNNANIDFSLQIGDGINPSTAYDENGNIISMSQKALGLYQSDYVDQISYRYENNSYSNKLLAIDEIAVAGTSEYAAENTLGDFKDNIPGGALFDYFYDANGNVIQDNNKGITSVFYNHQNKPTEIEISGKGIITFVYDAAGNKLQKIVQPLSGNSITYTYIDGFTYKEQQLQFFYTEEGRLRPTVSPTGVNGWAYDYFLKDRLGNIRAIVTDEIRTDIYPKATLEIATISNEQLYYDRTNIGLTNRPGAFGTQATNGDKVQLLQKFSQAIGVSKLVKVMVKDQINVSVDYYFPSQTVDNGNANGLNSLLTLLTTLFNSPGAPALLAGKGIEISQQLNSSSPLNTLLTPQNATQPSSTPKAYLNILFFDEQFRFVSQNSTFVGVTISGSLQTITRTYIEAPKNGYVYIYVSNESNNLVYFDNFQVSHIRGPLLQESHYNLFGAKLTALCSNALPGVSNSLGYQSKELNDEFDLDWYDFDARSYDPQIGRFLQQDPSDQFPSGYIGMANNWSNTIDPDGNWAFFDDVVAMAIGGVINVIGNIGNIQSPGDFFGYFAVGAVAGEATLYGGPVVGGAVLGLGNALVRGERDPLQLAKETLIGAGSSLIGSALGGAVSGVISAPLSRAIGSQASHIVSNIASTSLVGGAFGAAFSLANGGDPWQGFVSGMRTGAITGAVTTLVPLAINKAKEPKAPEVPKERMEIAPEKIEPTRTEIKSPEPQKLLPPPKYEFDKTNGAEHWLKHTKALKYEKGEFIKHPRKSKPDMPREFTLKQYTEGAKAFFGAIDNGTATFTNSSNGKIYMYNSQTKMFGTANATTGKIITWFKASDSYWLNQIKQNKH